MECLDRFKKRMEINGNSIRVEKIQNSRNLLNATFEDDPSYSIGVYMWELGKLGKDKYIDKDTIKIRLYNRTFSAANGWRVEFQTLNDTPIEMGDIIYVSKADEYLICTETFNIDDVHWQGKFTLCNWVLRWQKENGELLEYPCYDMNTTQYNSGEQSNKQFTIGSSQHMITLPCDENTIALATPRRFFLDKNKVAPTAFIVTQNDNTSYNYGKNGIVKITLFETVRNNETDRPDLGLCDYIDIENKEIDKIDQSSAIIKAVIDYETNVIKSGGSKRIFCGKFYDENNDLLDIEPKWNIICDFKEELEISIFDNKIVIGIDNDDYIDEEFKLVLSDIDDQYSTNIIIKIGSLI